MNHAEPAEDPTELRVDVQGLRLALRVWGPEDGAPVLALHGWLDNASTFDRLAPRLPGLRIAALDLPGHGQSEHRRHAYHYIDYIADAMATAAALGWSRFSLLGHSLGAGVAASLAGALGDRIERLVLIEGLGPLTDDPSLAPARLREAVAAELAFTPTTPPRRFADVEAAAQLRTKISGLPIDAARVLVPRSLIADDEGLRWSFDPRLRLTSRLRLSEAHVDAFLGAITCPTLLLRASNGWSFDAATEARRVAAIRDVTIVTLEGGHHLHLEAPEAVAAAIHGFLEPLRAAPAPRASAPS